MRMFKSTLGKLRILIFVITVSCDEHSGLEERQIYEEVMGSLIESWKLGAKFNMNEIQVHDFAVSGMLATFIQDNALMFFLPGETCNSCLERELDKYLEWDISVDKYILGLNANSTYLSDLKRAHPEIKGVFVVRNKNDFKDTVLLPHIVYYHQSTDTYLNYAAVKSRINHFDYFKTVVEKLINE